MDPLWMEILREAYNCHTDGCIIISQIIFRPLTLRRMTGFDEAEALYETKNRKCFDSAQLPGGAIFKNLERNLRKVETPLERYIRT